MLAIFQDLRLEKYLTEDAPKPSKTDKTTDEEKRALEAWNAGDSRARGRIVLAISDAEIVHILCADTAKQMWNQLAAVKEPKGRLGVLTARRTLYRLMAEEGFDMAEHVAKLRQLQDELHTMGNKVADEDFLMILITSLPESWDTFTTSYLGANGTKATLSSQELVGILMDEARRRKGKETNETVLQARQKGRGPSDRECYNCHKKGHMSRDCWAPGGGREGQGPSGRKGKDRSNQAQEQESLNNIAYMAFHSANNNEISKYDWVYDSATTSHICPNREAFIEFSQHNGSVKGIGSEVESHGRGTVLINLKVGDQILQHRLRNVLYIPSAPNCLMSTGRFDQSGGFSVFGNGKCILKDAKGRTVGEGVLKGLLYVLNARAQLHDEQANLATPNKPSWDQWHRRFGHISISSLQRLDKEGLVTGLSIDRSSIASSTCESCIQAKHARKPFPQEASNRSEIPGERTMSDVWGPIAVRSIGGYYYYISFMDDSTRFSTVLFLKDKTEAYDRVVEWCENTKRQFGKYPRWIRFDNGTEYINQKVKDWLASKGIGLESTAPYSPSQNEVAERFNRTMLELVRAMLFEKKLPDWLWDQAVAHANYLRNRAPTRALDGMTPHEAWFGKKPDVSHLREFGCDVWVHDETKNLSKLKPRAQKMIFMGFNDGSKSIRYYDPSKRNIKTSRNITFSENEEPRKMEYQEIPPSLRSEGEQEDSSVSETQIPEIEPDKAPVDQSPVNQPTDQTTPNQADNPNPLPNRTLRIRTPIDYHKSNNPAARKPGERFKEPSPVSPADPSRSTVSSTAKTRERAQFARQSDPVHEIIDQFMGLGSEEYAFISRIGEPDLPKSFEEAINCSEGEKWKEAIEAELKVMKEMGTWELVDLPAGRTPIGSKWVFDKKRDANGKIVKYKARLVAQGFSQKPGVDFSNNGTFAPVMRFETMRTGLALAAVNHFDLRQFDIKGAYLNGYVEEELYMKQPPGCDDGSGRVCRLIRSIYGLKQAGNVWNKELDEKLKELGFTRLKSDYCCYMRESGNEFVMAMVWVDDILSIASEGRFNDMLEKDLGKFFEIKSLGKPDFLLGTKVTQDPENYSISLSQTAYIETLLEKFGLQNLNPVTTPMDPNVKLDDYGKTDDPDKQGEQDTRVSASYAALIGSLMYLAISTRPDISFAVNKLAQFTNDPKPKHWTAVKRVFRYLKGTKSHALTYGGNDPNLASEDLQIFCDADWADGEDRKSISGYVLIIAGGAVAWSSRKQSTVACSTPEAEYIATAHVAKQVLWHRTLLEELGFHVPSTSTIFSDNQGAIAISHNPEFHARTKHIDIAYHFVRDHVQKGTLDTIYVYLPRDSRAPNTRSSHQ